MLVLPACTSAPSYPDRPIILICPWAAGGGTDRVSRQIAPFLEEELGVPVNVVNATGGAGVTGHARGARARPDGHTLMMMTVEINMLHWRNLTEISWTDFEPVGMINKDPAALFVRQDAEWQDLAALTSYIQGDSQDPGLTATDHSKKGQVDFPRDPRPETQDNSGDTAVSAVNAQLPSAVTSKMHVPPQRSRVSSLGSRNSESQNPEPSTENQTTLRASGTATGGIWHLALAGWLSAAKLDVDAIRWIPMNGAGPSLQELLSGGLDIVCCSLPEARTLLEAGEVRCLGVMSDERVEGHEEVPTFREFGVDWSLGGWRGIGLPKGTPQKIVDQVAQALERSVTGETRVAEANFPGLMKPQGFNVTYANPESFRESLDRTDQALGAVLKTKDFSSLSEGPVDSMRFPTILFTALGAILLALFLRRLGQVAEESETEGTSLAGVFHALEAVLCVVFFVWFAESLGFVLTSAVIVVYLLWRLGTRLITSAAIAFVLVPFVYHLFANVLRVPLARGLLGW
jgi:tripartite-type tricarboxylate transporter receptor subunit TctC